MTSTSMAIPFFSILTMNLKGMTLVGRQFVRFGFRGHVAAVVQADGNQRFPVKGHSGVNDLGSRLAKRMAHNEPKTCHRQLALTKSRC
jgi:hypothetical protein